MQQASIEILSSSADERRARCSGVAAHLETRAENVEKNLYVCWVLVQECRQGPKGTGFPTCDVFKTDVQAGYTQINPQHRPAACAVSISWSLPPTI